MNITDYSLSGSEIIIEENDERNTTLNSTDFFDFVAEDKKFIHDRERQFITVIDYVPAIDKARATISELPCMGSTLTYDDFWADYAKELENLLTRYLEAIDPIWEELEGQGIDDTFSSDYMLFTKEQRAFGFSEVNSF